MRFNKNIGIGADPVANKRIYLEMLASDVFGIDIDQIVNPFTGVGINKGIDVQREIRTPSGDFSLSNFVYDSHIDNYAGLKDTTVSRSISTDGVVCHAASYGDFEGTLGALAYMLVYGLDGFAADEGKDLSSGNARRYTYGANIAARNMVEVNKPSGAIELRTYGVNIDYAYLLPTLIAGTLTAKAFGLYANVLGNLAGDSVAYGVYTKVSGADKNYGYYSEDPSLRSAPITAVPTDIPDEGTFRIYGPAGGPYRIYIYLDGAWRLVASHPHASRHVAGGDDDLFSTDLIPTTDGLFLGSDTKRWDGSKLINLPIEHSLTRYRRSGQYHRSFVCGGATVLTISANYLYAYAFYVPTPTTFDRIAVMVATAVAGSARLGIYSDDGNCYPASLVLDAGTVDTGTTGMKEIVINQTLSAGLYWLVFVTNAGPIFYGATYGYQYAPIGTDTFDMVSRHMWFVSFTFGSLPSTFPSGAVNQPYAMCVALRKA